MGTLHNLQHVISADQFDREMLDTLFDITDGLSPKPVGSSLISLPDEEPELPMRGKVLASMFYEPSMRTRFSFEAAMLRLGGSVIGTENAKEFSSAVKGESIEDAVEVVSEGCYADAIVLRTSKKGDAQRAARASSVPVLNGGDGSGEHPTQALLDLYTIRQHFGNIDGKHVSLVGDLKYGRTVHSLARLLALHDDVTISFVSPDILAIPQDVIDHLEKAGVAFEETSVLRDVVRQSDVVYMTRTQRERHSWYEQWKYYQLAGSYTFKPEYLDRMKNGRLSGRGIIMHPLPRGPEIPDEVKNSPYCVAFKQQVRAGLLVRMALLKVLLS